MRKPKHTRGPWLYEAEDNLILSHDGRRLVTYSPRSVDVPLEERVANGCLIAAAPELLEALEFFSSQPITNSISVLEEARRLAGAAIAKATSA